MFVCPHDARRMLYVRPLCCCVKLNLCPRKGGNKAGSLTRLAFVCQLVCLANVPDLVSWLLSAYSSRLYKITCEFEKYKAINTIKFLNHFIN